MRRGGRVVLAVEHVAVGGSSGQVGAGQYPAQVSQVGSRGGGEWQGLQASNVAPSARQGVDDGVHGLAVRVQSFPVGNQVRILTNFVQPATW